MEYKDYYKILGVERTASSEEIQKAYRKLARTYHPDLNKKKGAEDHFKEIGEAYEVLKDTETRERYDALGSGWQAGQEFRPPPEWDQKRQGQAFQFNFGGDSGGQTFAAGEFSDFFESIFGGARSFGHQQSANGPFTYESGAGSDGFEDRQASHEAEITISLDDAISGATKLITFKVPGDKESKTLRVKIPSGTVDGSRIRLAKQAQGKDLFLRVRVAPDARYKIVGSDLAVQLPVSPWEAALGTTIDVPLPDGQIKVKVPPGSQTGSRLRVRGKGMPRGNGVRGDLMLEIQIAVPKTISDREREMYEQLAAISTFNPRESIRD